MSVFNGSVFFDQQAKQHVYVEMQVSMAVCSLIGKQSSMCT